ncbi:MAG TPA: universal stress protein [Roseiflexaceae bacterium]|nr:universal stress protein [Roseiflexaceae bacterium]
MMTTYDAREPKQATDQQSATGAYARIVVALDGSARAELVLPYVETLAEQFGSSVTLLRATTPAAAIAGPAVAATMPPLAPNVAATPIDPSAVVAAERRQVERYLHAVAQRLRSRGLMVSPEQHEGSAADVIVRRARELDASVIAMTTHGRGGLERLVFGSTADAVLRHAPCPILLVRVGQAPGESG